jgi:hypothetical protein
MINTRVDSVVVYFFLVLLCPITGISAVGGLQTPVLSGIDRDAASSTKFEDEFGPITDPLTWLKFLEAQVFFASINDTLPRHPFLRALTTLGNFDSFKLRPCAREEVAKCLAYGEVAHILSSITRKITVISCITGRYLLYTRNIAGEIYSSLAGFSYLSHPLCHPRPRALHRRATPFLHFWECWV